MCVWCRQLCERCVVFGSRVMFRTSCGRVMCLLLLAVCRLSRYVGAGCGLGRGGGHVRLMMVCDVRCVCRSFARGTGRKKTLADPRPVRNQPCMQVMYCSPRPLPNCCFCCCDCLLAHLPLPPAPFCSATLTTGISTVTRLYVLRANDTVISCFATTSLVVSPSSSCSNKPLPSPPSSGRDLCKPMLAVPSHSPTLTAVVQSCNKGETTPHRRRTSMCDIVIAKRALRLPLVHGKGQRLGSARPNLPNIQSQRTEERTSAALLSSTNSKRTSHTTSTNSTQQQQRR